LFSKTNHKNKNAPTLQIEQPIIQTLKFSIVIHHTHSVNPTPQKIPQSKQKINLMILF
jgi:hypothetical protein